MRLLTKDDVLAAADLPTEDVAVPEWGEGVGVRIRTLTCAEHKAFTKRVKDLTTDAEVTAHLVVACAVDESGGPLFTPADIPLLMQKSVPAVTRIGREAIRLNGLQPGAVEDARKNS